MAAVLTYLQGLFGGPWYRKFFKLFNTLFGLACLSAACLGLWGAAEAIKATFAIAGAATSFGCKAPVWWKILWCMIMTMCSIDLVFWVSFLFRLARSQLLDQRCNRVHLYPLLVQFRSLGGQRSIYLGPATSPDIKDLPRSSIWQYPHISAITITAMNWIAVLFQYTCDGLPGSNQKWKVPNAKWNDWTSFDNETTRTVYLIDRLGTRLR